VTGTRGHERLGVARAMTLPSLGRSAAELISINKRFPSSCTPLDRLLGGGLPSGHVLELSGPPGTAKEILATKFASSAVSSNEEVLFVGKIPTQGQILHPYLYTRHAEYGQPYFATFRTS
jgi:predicted ATP-dependent serine protease